MITTPSVLGKGRTRESMIAALKRSGNLAYRALTEGHWQARANRPLAILDPAKFAHYARREHLILPQDFGSGVITHRELEGYQAFASRQFRKLFDSILSGGGLKWADSWQNLVVDEGLNHLLDVTLSGGSQDTSWFVGLLGSSPTALAAWTASDLAAVDFVNYDEASLQAWTDGGVSSQSVSNSASPATFTVSTNGSTIGGAFLIGTNAKATPAGTLYAAGAFSGGNKSLDDGDTLDVTATFTMAAA